MIVNRRLLERCDRAIRPVKKPTLNARHKGFRLCFATQHRNLTVHVVFGESRFLLHHVDGRVRVSRLRGEALRNDCVMFNQTGGGSSVNVWGAFHHGGASDLVLDRNVTGLLYRDILDQNLIPFARQHFQDNFCYQDDNAPGHRARVVRDFLEQEQAHTLYQPPLSPDCNPIEHFWDALQRAVDARHVNPQNPRKLSQALQEERRNMGADTLHNLADSMPQRIAAVARDRGGHANYWRPVRLRKYMTLAKQY